MRGKTLTRRELETLAKQFNLGDGQSVIDVHAGFAIVLDRGAEKFTVLPPHSTLRYSPFHGAKARWTTNLTAAYRIAREGAEDLKLKKPLLVIYQTGHDRNVGVGYANVEIGRIMITDATTKKKVESNYYSTNHWPGTLASARKYAAKVNKAMADLRKAESELSKRKGRRIRYVDDVVLIQADIAPKDHER